MTIKRLQTAYHVVADMPGARRFYEEVLGLRLKFADGERWAQYDAGGANFAIGSPAEGPPGAAGAVIVFEVDSVDDFRARAAAAGIEIQGERDMGGHGRVLTLADPEGHPIQLFERAPQVGG
ncbi:VOC family protein [Inquilinus sp. NPDC058860]|uniref:VOC family protein n=1 Tax=Inquilinus sp. NPDC058860 TaxID=3346652 RepID=UPI0036B00D10